MGSKDEIGVLTENFNVMARQLRDTLAQVENERNKLDTLFLHMTDGVVAFSRAGLVIHSNPAANRMLRRVRDFAQVRADGVITKTWRTRPFVPWKLTIWAWTRWTGG